MRCGLAGSDIFRPGWRMPLNPSQLLFVQNLDGLRTIRDIAAAAGHSQAPVRGDVAGFEKFGRKLFEALWRLDFVAMELCSQGQATCAGDQS